MVLVKNWDFGEDGTITDIEDLNANFNYHDQFGTYIMGGGNYGAKVVSPDVAHALSGQPIEGTNSPAVRQFTSDALRTFLTPLDGATLLDVNQHNAGCGSVVAAWKLPFGGSLLGQDLVWETRVRMVTPPYFWTAIWTSGNAWDHGAEMDVLEAFGYDNGGGNTNFDGAYWHSNSVGGADSDGYGNWSASMAAHGFTDYDATQYHVWTWLYRKDDTYSVYVDGHRSAERHPRLAARGDGHERLRSDRHGLRARRQARGATRAIPQVNQLHLLPSSAFDGVYYDWDYSRIYLGPAAAASRRLPAPDDSLPAAPLDSATLLNVGGRLGRHGGAIRSFAARACRWRR